MKLEYPKRASDIVIFVNTEYLLKNSAILHSLITMSTGERKKAVTLALMAVLLIAFPNIKNACSVSSGATIDLFTRKEPYSGRGRNVQSDAFGPEESVVLHALVTYDNTPVQALPIAFHIVTPSNASFSLSTLTNASGIATTSLTILTLPIGVNESDIFGKWSISANALVNNTLVQDTLAFKVDWVVKLLSVRTIDNDLNHRTSFGRGGDVGLEVALRSIAMTTKNTTIAIVIQDEFNAPVSFTEINNFSVQPNEKLILAYFKLRIPSWVIPGNATIFVTALTLPGGNNGVPYCPSVSTHFLVSPYEPIMLDFHDAAVVNVVSSVGSVERGQPLTVNVLVGNEGTATESFNVNVYVGNTLVSTQQVTELLSHSKQSFDLNVDTSALDIGNYTISASIPSLANEADTTDNLFISASIEIKPYNPPIVHNVAITNVRISNSSVSQGELLQISVNVSNKGTETETFDVSTYYSSSLIETILIQALLPNTCMTSFIAWNTSLANVGFYEISANAELPDDVDSSDNTFVAGLVEVRIKPPPIHDIAVSNVFSSALKVYIGDDLNVNVTVKNNGDQAESFNVLLSYDNNSIGTLRVNALSVGAEHILAFNWATTTIPEGNYTLTAFAEPVSGETNTTNNTFIYGTIRIVTSPTSYAALAWFNWTVLLLLALLIVLCLLWFVVRRKKKKSEETFYSGWVAWYYCCDPERRLSNTDSLRKNLKEI